MTQLCLSLLFTRIPLTQLVGVGIDLQDVIYGGYSYFLQVRTCRADKQSLYQGQSS